MFSKPETRSGGINRDHLLRLGSFLSLLAVLLLACAWIAAPFTSKERVPEVPTAVSRNTGAATQENVEPSKLQNSALVDFYDPRRDPAQDLKQAIPIAQQENKRIMLELGGDWCIWCKYMDEFYRTHSDILQFRADHYVLVKVNVSPENMNERFLAQYPVAAGYPHIYILDSDGTFLHSQDTAVLENRADSYVPETFMAFLQKWAPPSK